MNLLAVLWFILGIFCFDIEVQAKVRGTPGVDYPNYSSIPNTSFKCSDQLHIPGFYADIETNCQVFHHCYEHRKESFLCPEGTAFNQAIHSCDYWYSFDCNSPLKPHRHIERNKYKDAPFLPVKIYNTSNVFEKMAALYNPNEKANISIVDDSSSISDDDGNLNAFSSSGKQYLKGSANSHDEDSSQFIQSDRIRIKQTESDTLGNFKYENIVNRDGTDIVLLEDIDSSLIEDSESYVSDGDQNIEVSGESKIMLSDAPISDMVDPHEMLVKRLSGTEVSRKKLRRKPKYVVLQTQPELEFSGKKDQDEKLAPSVKVDMNADNPSNIFSYNEKDEIYKHHVGDANIIISPLDKPKRKRKPIELSNEVTEKSTGVNVTSPLMTGNVMDTFTFSIDDQTITEPGDITNINIDNNLPAKNSSIEDTGINRETWNVTNLESKSNEIFESLGNVGIKSDSNDLTDIKQSDTVEESDKTEHVIDDSHYFTQTKDENPEKIFEEKKVETFKPEIIKTGRYLDDSFEHGETQDEEILIDSIDATTPMVNNEETSFHVLNENSDDHWANLGSDSLDSEYESTESNMLKNEILNEEYDEENRQSSDNYNSKNMRLDNSLTSTDTTEYFENDNEDKFQDNIYPADYQLNEDQSKNIFESLENVNEETYMESDGTENVQHNIDNINNAMHDNQLEYLNYQTVEDNFYEDSQNTEGQTYENIDSVISMSTDVHLEYATEYSTSVEDISITEEPFVSDESVVTSLEELPEGDLEFLNEDVENQEYFTETSENYDFTTHIENLEEQEINEVNDIDSELAELEYEDESGNLVVVEDKNNSYSASQIFDQPKENLPIKQNAGVKIPESHYAHSELEKSIDSTFHTSSMPLPSNSYERNLYLQNVRQDQIAPTNSISHPSFYKELKAGSVSNENLPEVLKSMYEASQTASTGKKSQSKKAKSEFDASNSKLMHLNDGNSIKTPVHSEFSTSPFFDNRRSTNRLNEMLPAYLSEMKRNEVFSARMGKMSKPAKFKKLISFGKKLLAMKRAKLNMFKKFLQSFTQENF